MILWYWTLFFLSSVKMCRRDRKLTFRASSHKLGILQILPSMPKKHNEDKVLIHSRSAALGRKVLDNLFTERT